MGSIVLRGPPVAAPAPCARGPGAGALPRRGERLAPGARGTVGRGCRPVALAPALHGSGQPAIRVRRPRGSSYT
eukprot:scaffold9734_cov38-Prasinocladus_malaysianus.AAC.1